MKVLKIPINVEISSLADLTRLAVDISKKLKQGGEPENASILADIALKLERESGPHFISDAEKAHLHLVEHGPN
jgi:hypothetical protein